MTEIGLGQGGPMDSGLMLTRDQNIVDMGYQIVWNVSDPEQYLFNLLIRRAPSGPSPNLRCAISWRVRNWRRS